MYLAIPTIYAVIKFYIIFWSILVKVRMQLTALALVNDSDSDIGCPVCGEHYGDRSAT